MKRYLNCLVIAVAAMGFCACDNHDSHQQVIKAEAKPYLAIQEITTPNKMHYWLVQDKTIPVVALRFSLKGGTRHDPQGLEGIGSMLTTLLDEGAGKRDAETFQSDLDVYGIQMGFSANRDYFQGSLKTTVQFSDVAVDLFDDALNDPHFDADAVERMREALQSQLRFNQMNPAWIAGQELFNTVFGGSSYARPEDGTQQSLAAITPADIRAYKDHLFCKDILHISVVGDVDAAQASAMVDRVFSNWKQCAPDMTQPEKVTLKHAGETRTIEWNGAQHSVVMVQRGLPRLDKDWWAARILDFALGGGQFSSRLMDEVRVKRSLTYGVSSGIASYDLSPLWMVQSSVDPAKTAEAITVIKDIWRDVAKNGLSDTEIRAAKDYLIGSLPLALTSTDAIAAIVLQLQDDGLPKNTLDMRRKEIEAVTADDIRRVATQYLDADAMTTVIVGPKMNKIP